MVTKLFRVFYETQGLRLDILLPAFVEAQRVNWPATR